LKALLRLVASLPSRLSAAVFVVIHVSARHGSTLPQLIRRDCRLPAVHAVDYEVIRRGRIYVARPDFHLLLKSGYMRVVQGPKENRFRPAIDPLFRTAAAEYGERVVGVILSGLLDDGTHGAMLIKRSNGVVIVQHPDEAEAPSMPLSVLRYVKVDYSLPAAKIASVIAQLAGQLRGGDSPVMMSSKAETYDVVEGATDALRHVETLGPPSFFVCPECGGALWEFKEDQFIRYRCHVGHGFTAELLRDGQMNNVEGSIWQAIQRLEEKAALCRHFANESRRAQRESAMTEYYAAALKSMLQADRLREIWRDVRQTGSIPRRRDPPRM
jgi:two-component system chemotaxis response regulator CheB